MPEDYAAQLPCCADRGMAGSYPGCAALPRPSATVMTSELPRFPIGDTFGQTQTNQRVGRGTSDCLQAEFAPNSPQTTILSLNRHGSKTTMLYIGQPMDSVDCVRIATEVFDLELRHAPRAVVPGDACLNNPVLRPIGESKRGLRTCR